MSTVVEAQDVTRLYRMGSNQVHALNGVSFSIEQGEFVTIMGSSGSGKSTLLNILGCLDKPTTGIVKINGVDLGKLNDDELTRIRRLNVGFIFQQFNLIPTLTALENVEIPMIFNRMPPAKRQIRAMQLLEAARLDPAYASHKPGELSGGQQQRVAIARALANDPAIILADEPTGNLDSKTGKEIMELLDNLNRQGRTLIVVTHDPAITEYSGRTIRLQDGEVLNEAN
jgi:putative ABC transport system ATP-binding protein